VGIFFHCQQWKVPQVEVSQNQEKKKQDYDNLNEFEVFLVKIQLTPVSLKNKRFKYAQKKPYI